MANISAPYGLRPINLIGGQPFAGSTRLMKIASEYGTDIFFGDVVQVAADGTIQKVTNVGTAADPFPAGTVGVFLGCQLSAYSPSAILGVSAQSWTAGTKDTGAYALVADDPDVCFQIQANGTMAQSTLHGNYGLVQTAGDAMIGNSKVALDTASAGTADTIAFKVIDFVNGPFSKVGDDYTDVIVKFNPKSHAYLSGTGI